MNNSVDSHSFHETHGMDVSITNSTLLNYQFNFLGKFAAKQSAAFNLVSQSRVSIQNSTFGHKEQNVEAMVSLNFTNGNVSLDGVQIVRAKMKNASAVIFTECNAGVKNSQFVENTGGSDGTVRVESSRLIIVRSTFEQNKASNGGAVLAHNSNISLFHCNFSHNYANCSANKESQSFERRGFEYNIGGHLFGHDWPVCTGGAVFAKKSVISMSKCNFFGNHADNSGGAVYAFMSQLEINQTHFNSNTAVNGGAMFLYRSNLSTNLNCTFEENWSHYDASALAAYDRNNLQIRQSFFLGNRANLNAAILSANQRTNVTFESCQFANNTAAIAQMTATRFVNITMKDCLIANNTSNYTGILRANFACNITLINCSIISNTVRVKALIWILNSTLTVTSSQFFKNQKGCVVDGRDLAAVHLVNCTFSDHALLGEPIIFMLHSRATFEHCTFRHNIYSNSGGIAIARYGTLLTVTDCHFEQNKPASQGGNTGGIFFLSQSNGTFQRCSFIENTAGEASVAYVDRSVVSFKNVTIENCTALGYGGVIRADGSKVTIEESKISRGQADFGGCLSLQQGSSLKACNSIFNECTAKVGGTMYQHMSDNITLDNCTVYSSFDTKREAIFFFNGAHLRISGGSCHMQKQGICIKFAHNEFDTSQQSTFFTFNFTVSRNQSWVNSRTDKDFLRHASSRDLIAIPQQGIMWEETPYASSKLFLTLFARMPNTCETAVWDKNVA